MLAAAWEKVSQELDSWFDLLWRLLYPWKTWQLSPSLPHHLQLCLWTTLPWHAPDSWQKDRSSLLLSGYSDVRVTPGWHGPVADTRDQQTGDQAPRCHPGCSRLVPDCPGWHSTAAARAVPSFWPQGERVAPHLQLLRCVSGFACLLQAALGFLLSSTVWQHLSFSKQAGDAGQRGKGRQSTCLAFPSPCMLKFILCLISSARHFEIINVTFLLLFIYPNLSHFLL